MSVNIKNDETERLVRELVASTGESVTGAVTVAVRERLARLQSADESGARERARRLHQISADAASRWVEPHRSTDHAALLYDDAGLPR